MSQSTPGCCPVRLVCFVIVTAGRDRTLPQGSRGRGGDRVRGGRRLIGGTNPGRWFQMERSPGLEPLGRWKMDQKRHGLGGYPLSIHTLRLQVPPQKGICPTLNTF